MSLLPDPGDRHGLERIVYRVGNWLALLLMAACGLAVIGILWLAWQAIRGLAGLF